jgi:hypothetical protein
MSENYDPAVPSAVLEQDVPVGGADLDGRMPGAALATVPVGIATVREVPALTHNSARFALVADGDAIRIGRTVQRRRLVVSVSASATATAYVIAGDNKQQAESGFGLEIPQGTMLVLGTAADLWFAAFGADLYVSWLQELDQG